MSLTPLASQPCAQTLFPGKPRDPKSRALTSVGRVAVGPFARKAAPSVLAGTFEDRRWKRISKLDAKKHIAAAREYDRQTRGQIKGRRNGALGHVAVAVYEYLVNCATKGEGRLYPSAQAISERIKHCPDAIYRALAALSDHGFLDRVRRYVRTSRSGRGPQVAQTSNAYFLKMPERAWKLVRSWFEVIASADLKQLTLDRIKQHMDYVRQADQFGIGAIDTPNRAVTPDHAANATRPKRSE